MVQTQRNFNVQSVKSPPEKEVAKASPHTHFWATRGTAEWPSNATASPDQLAHIYIYIHTYIHIYIHIPFPAAWRCGLQRHMRQQSPSHAPWPLVPRVQASELLWFSNLCRFKVDERPQHGCLPRTSWPIMKRQRFENQRSSEACTRGTSGHGAWDGCWGRIGGRLASFWLPMFAFWKLFQIWCIQRWKVLKAAGVHDF